MRQALNSQLRDRAECTTDGAGTYARLWTSEAMPSNAVWQLTVDAVAVSPSGAFAGGAFLRWNAAQSNAGVVSLLAADTLLGTRRTNAAIEVRFGVDAVARVVYAEARDDGATALRFVGVVHLVEASR